jgi:selenocysteine lyase/cysteine desulfurase
VSSGLTSFQVEGKKADDVVASLWDNFGIVVRQVNELSCVRASSHFFNTEEELEKLTNATLSLL